MLLTVKNLGKQYTIEKGLFSAKVSVVDALCDINFELKKGSVLGIVGETGSGKTTLAKLIVKLIEPTNGKIIYHATNIPRSIQMIFQNPFSSLNPMLKVKNILQEPFLIHKICKRSEIRHKLNILLDRINLTGDSLNRYPDEFSGGQRQRIAIARAIAVEPELLVCDEPTASLDLSVQAQILNLFIKLKEELGLSYIFISHNIEVISFIADEVLVLYKGRQVERGVSSQIFNSPLHPYTKLLLGLERIEYQRVEEENNGCKFYPSCKFRSKTCIQIEPQEVKLEEGHYVSCHNIK